MYRWFVPSLDQGAQHRRPPHDEDVGRRREAQKANFFVHYECDDETVQHVLKLDGYDGDEEECWVLLELTPAAAANAAAAEEAGEA